MTEINHLNPHEWFASYNPSETRFEMMSMLIS